MMFGTQAGSSYQEGVPRHYNECKVLIEAEGKRIEVWPFKTVHEFLETEPFFD